MRLFDDMERTFTGLAEVNESHFSFLNRSAIDRAVVARELCERWYEDYSKDAAEAELKRFRSSFRSSIYRQHYSAWFELLVHQILLRLGFSVSTHPDLHGTDKHPDFAATSGDSRILVEATVVAPDNDPFALSPFEQDAQRKLAQLKSTNFFLWILEARGTLDRFLPSRQLLRPFQELLDKHDPDDVTRLIDEEGERAQPMEVIRIRDWELTVALWPVSPDKRSPRENRVIPWGRVAMHDSSVPQTRKEISTRSRKYGPADDPLFLAVNVHNRIGFDPELDGNETLFGQDGIWNRKKHPRSARPTGVIFLTDTNSYSLQGTQACLYVNPSTGATQIPNALLRLPRFQGVDGSTRIGGESVTTILGLS